MRNLRIGERLLKMAGCNRKLAVHTRLGFPTKEIRTVLFLAHVYAIVPDDHRREEYAKHNRRSIGTVLASCYLT